MFRWMLVLWLIVAAATCRAAERGRLLADPPVVVQVRLENQAIGPITAQFLQRAIQQAEQRRAECLLLVLNTPGGLADSTRSIVQDLLASKVPVVVYVSPPGARAASAGMFITLAAHVSAMAPGTNIGAAHPVEISGLPGTPPLNEEEKTDKPRSTPREEKLVNDTVAWARSLAELRGRNAEWAARAVRESISAAASEAVNEGAVDLLADDVDDLLDQLDGRNVELPSGTVRLRTANAEVVVLEMWWGERLLALITNPNMAFLLLIFGFYGILFELYSPGWGVAGTFGVACVLLAFLALAILPISYVGLGLLALALALFAAEVFVTSYGALTIAGLVCLVLGGTMLVDSPAGFQRVSFGVTIPVAAATALITIFLAGSIVRAHRRRVQTGTEALTGSKAVAEEAFSAAGDRYAGMVLAQGELWRGMSDAPVTAGQELEIEGRDGLTLRVRPPASSDGPSSSAGPIEQSVSP
jgi:membrane-bound serine protease (ClpP class)